MSEIATRPPQQQLAAQVRSETFQEQLGLILDDAERKRYTRLAVTAVLTNPQIAQDLTDLNSFFSALLACAADGLVPDGKQAAIIIRKGKATFQPMVDGLRQQAGEYGWSVTASVVYENDEFEYTDEPPALTHTKTRTGHERGKLVAVYAIARHPVLPRQQLVFHEEDVAKRRAKATTQAIWNEWPAEMWEKTVVKALVNDLAKPERFRVESPAAVAVPVDSAAAVYGPEARHALENPPAPALTVERADAAASAAGAAGSQPAGDTALPGSPAADLDYGPDEVAHDLAERARMNADAAAHVRAPARTMYAGETIEEIAAKGEDGTKFFQWSLEPERFRRWYDRGEVYAQALPVWARHYRPELLAGREEAAA